MKLLNPMFDIDRYVEKVSRSRKRILMFDYDGTLAPFVADRENAAIYPELSPIIKSLTADNRNRLILVTGRPNADIQKLWPFESTPEIWGQHGLERHAINGTYKSKPVDRHVSDAILLIQDWAHANGLRDSIEAKPAALAFHWRGLSVDEAHNIKDKIIERWLPVLKDNELALREFDGGLELRITDINKGSAVETILTESGPDQAIAYFGDDLTDEDAFEQIKDHGLAVLVREQLRPTKADLWLLPPLELAEFLHHWFD